MRRGDLVKGQPFITIPQHNRPSPHKVLSIFNRSKIKLDAVEMVFNDTVLMNFTYRNSGHQSEDDDPPESTMKKIRELARALYGEYGQWIEENFGTICIECRRTLPDHIENCKAGIEYRKQKSFLPPTSTD